LKPEGEEEELPSSIFCGRGGGEWELGEKKFNRKVGTYYYPLGGKKNPGAVPQGKGREADEYLLS